MTRHAQRIFKGTIAAVFASCVLLGGASAQADDGAPKAAAEEEARLHFSAGVNLLRDPARPRYEEAYLEFKKAYSLAPSPKILGNIGLCAMKLERDSEAIEAYARYLAEVPDLPQDERAQIERDVTTLKVTLAKVLVETQPAGASIIDTRMPAHGEAITNTYGPITGRTELALRKGHHVLKARFENGVEVTWESDINGGESHLFDAPASPIEPPPPSNVPRTAAPMRPLPTSVLVSGGVTAALGIGALATGLIAIDTRSRFDERNDGSDPSGADDLRGTGKALNVVSDIFLVGALVGAGVTAYLYFTRPSSAAAAARAPFSVRF